MTQRERELLKILKDDPLISQQELADKLNIARSSVAVHITNLMKKGYIKGKGYILNEENKITIIGGANIDLQGFPKSSLIMEDSNVGTMTTSLGGVGRNIAENLVRLGESTRLISVVGDDFYGKKILEESNLLGLDVDHTLVVPGESTSTYMSIMDENKDMKVAISSMDILSNLNSSFFRKKTAILRNSSAIAIDTNLPQDSIEFICEEFKDLPLFLDPVSTTKAKKVMNLLKYFHTIKPNIHEAQILYGKEIHSIEDVKKAGEYFLKKGIKRAFISLGKDGIFCCSDSDSFVLKAINPMIKSATGAGDAFMAGTLLSHKKNLSLKESAIFSLGASLAALQDENTINPRISEREVKRIISNSNIDLVENI